jgi:hypothetical protein
MDGVCDVPTPTGTFRTGPPKEAAIWALAERQHGVLSVQQFEALGVSKSGVRSRVAAGRLRRVHRGVYRVGPGALDARGRWMAAVLAAGPGAVLSHRSAAALWGVLDDARARADVTVPLTRRRSRAGVAVHESSSLPRKDVATVDGIPCTSLARTFLDLAEAVPKRHLDRAIEQAEVLGLFDGRAIADVLDRANGRRGAGRLRRAIAPASHPALTASELEERFLELCRRSGVPRPAVNAWIATDENGHLMVDFLWRAERLVVETDGWAFHRSRAAFERDRRRDQVLELAGYRVLRFTWRQVARDPARVEQLLGRLLPSR